MTRTSEKTLTGRKVLFILLTFFGVVTAANVAMIYAATDTFPGLVVRNSYDASQIYDAERDAQAALGWRAAADLKDGVLAVAIRDTQDQPVRGLTVSAVVGRPATTAEDREIELVETDGAYTARPGLKKGIWRVDIRAQGGPDENFRAEARLYQPGDRG